LPAPVGARRFVIRATHERGVGAPSSRSLATASREARPLYGNEPTRHRRHKPRRSAHNSALTGSIPVSRTTFDLGKHRFGAVFKTISRLSSPPKTTVMALPWTHVDAGTIDPGSQRGTRPASFVARHGHGTGCPETSLGDASRPGLRASFSPRKEQPCLRSTTNNASGVSVG
jgi:hypothetical protein